VIVLISPVIHLQLVIERHPTLSTPGALLCGFKNYSLRLHFITIGAFQLSFAGETLIKYGG
jgi:hypothetical protein